MTTVFWQGTWFVLFQFPHPNLILPLIKLAYSSIIFIPVALYHFSVTFLNAEKDKRFLFPAYLSGLFFLITLHTTDLYISGYYQYFFGFYPKAGLVLHPVYILWLTVLAGRAIFLIFLSTQESSLSVEKHRQRKLLLIAFCIYTMAAIDFLCNYGVEFYPFGYIFILIALGIIGYTIVQYRLMDIDTVIHKTGMWLTISSLIILPAGGIYLFGKKWLEEQSPMTGAVVVGILTLLMIPYIRMVQSKIDALFQRRKYNMQRILRKLLRDIAALKGIPILIQKMIQTMREEVYASKISVLLWSNANQSFQVIKEAEAISETLLTLDNPFLTWLSKHNRIIAREEIELNSRQEAVWPSAQSYFNQFEAELVIPFVHDEKMIGLMNLGKKKNLKPYSDIDLEFLSTLQAEVSIALSNSIMYDDLKVLSQGLRHSNEELQRFAHVVAHDLGEPMRTVAGAVGFLSKQYKGQLDKDADQFIGFAVEGANRMHNLINDLLKYTKASVESPDLLMVNASGALQSSLANLYVTITESNAKVTSDPLPEVMANPIQLISLFQNLVANAIKFKGTQPIEIHVSVEQIAGEKPSSQEWRFSVRDNGIGIDPRAFEQIFVIFQRLHTRSEYSGTGVGLAICKKIVESNGGRIWVESELGKGATFYFTLKVSKTG